MNAVDRAIVNDLQNGFPICERPYAAAAAKLGIPEDELLERLSGMLARGVLTRFGPLYNAERMGGGLSLAAMAVPEEDFERVVAVVNAYPEVAHNYRREHRFNLWFVLATAQPQRIADVVAEIAAQTGYRVFNLPKEEEFFVGLRLEV